jgi:hypothetical protein
MHSTEARASKWRAEPIRAALVPRNLSPKMALRDSARSLGSKRNPPPRPKSKRGRAGDRTRTGDVQLGKLAFYH